MVTYIRKPLVATVVVMMLSACAARGPLGTQPDAAWPGVVSDTADIPFAEHGILPVFTTSLTTDGRNLHLRALVGNPYREPVEGVRAIFEVMAVQDPEGETLDRFERVMDVTIPSGERTSLRWDLQTMYAGSGAGGFRLVAFAVKRGGVTMPVPPGWTGD